ncbi:MAG: hypothetical protein OEQ47_10665 [Acidimicrobiia bacterium]|nr:hypothetical protein [Acidimicrobiia bacterium]
MGLPIVMLALFREAFRRSQPLLAALVEFGLVAVGAVGFAFGIGHLSRRVPGRRVVLGTRADSPKAPGTPSEVSS